MQRFHKGRCLLLIFFANFAINSVFEWKIQDGKTCRDFMKEDRNVLASKIHSKNVDESVKEMEKMYSTEKEHKIMKESTGKGNNRKRKIIFSLISQQSHT